MTTIYYEEDYNKSFFDHIYPDSNCFIKSYIYKCIFSGINDNEINNNKIKKEYNENDILNELADDYFKQEENEKENNNNYNYINIKIGLSIKNYLNYVYDDINNSNCVKHQWGYGTINSFAKGFNDYAYKLKKILQDIEFNSFNNLDIKHPLNIFLNIFNILIIYDNKYNINSKYYDYAIKYIEFEYNNINICIHLNELYNYQLYKNKNKKLFINRKCNIKKIKIDDYIHFTHYNIIFFYNNNNTKHNELISFYFCYDINNKYNIYDIKETELTNILFDYMNTRKYLLKYENINDVFKNENNINYINDIKFINNYYKDNILNIFIDYINENYNYLKNSDNDESDIKFYNNELKHIINDLNYIINNYCNFKFLIKFNFKNFNNIIIDKLNTSNNIKLINNININEINFGKLKINIINPKNDEIIIKCNKLLKKIKKESKK